MKIQRKELNQIAKGVELYDAQNLQNFRLTLLLVKNKKLIDAEVETFDQAKQKILPTDEIQKFNDERAKLAKSYWKKDEKGEYIMTENNGQPIHELTNAAELQGKIEKLFEKYKKVFDRNDAGIKKAEEILNEEITINLHKITSLDHVKQLSPKTLAALAPIIECKIPEKILEEKGDALNTSELERILTWCEISETNETAAK